MIMTTADLKTAPTPHQTFKLVGGLENADVIKAIALQVLNDPEHGAKVAASDPFALGLCKLLEHRLNQGEAATRADWSRLKELCLLRHGDPIADLVDHLTSGMRTLAVAESAMKASGHALYRAFDAMTGQTTPHADARSFFRSVMAEHIHPLTDEERQLMGLNA